MWVNVFEDPDGGGAVFRQLPHWNWHRPRGARPWLYITKYLHTYAEFHNVCPLVGTGTSPPLSRKQVCPGAPPPPEPKDGGTLACGWGVREFQFRRLEKKLSTPPSKFVSKHFKLKTVICICTTGGRSANKFRKSQIRKFADLNNLFVNVSLSEFTICRPNLFCD